MASAPPGPTAVTSSSGASAASAFCAEGASAGASVASVEGQRRARADEQRKIVTSNDALVATSDALTLLGDDPLH